MNTKQALEILNTGLLKALKAKAKQEAQQADAKVLETLNNGLLEALRDKAAIKMLDRGLLKALKERDSKQQAKRSTRRAFA